MTRTGCEQASSSAVLPHRVLRQMFDAAVRRASAEVCLPGWLPNPPKGRTVVVGAGKAAAAMARVVEERWHSPLSGLVITRHGHALPCQRIEVAEAGHPLSDDAGVQATARMLAMLEDLGADDLVICLISGGGSALLAAPPPGVSLADERALIKDLLGCGAAISELNCVRKHLSLARGGRLALAAAPARVVTLIISDVPGDEPSTIASGPTIPDPTRRREARDVIAAYGLRLPQSIADWLDNPASETPKPGAFQTECHLVATPQMALEAAAEVARGFGYRPLILGSAIEGEARECARLHADIVRQVRLHGEPAPAPCVLLSGGETTVTVTGPGRGGRNAEFLLALSLALDGMEGVHAIAADTDGIDGSEDNAGAIVGPDILARGQAAGISAPAHLAANDAYGFFQAAESLLVTGPTLTNVNDFRAILIDPVP